MMPLVVFKIVSFIGWNNLTPALNFKTLRLGCIAFELDTLVQAVWGTGRPPYPLVRAAGINQKAGHNFTAALLCLLQPATCRCANGMTRGWMSASWTRSRPCGHICWRVSGRSYATRGSVLNWRPVGWTVSGLALGLARAWQQNAGQRYGSYWLCTNWLERPEGYIYIYIYIIRIKFYGKSEAKDNCETWDNIKMYFKRLGCEIVDWLCSAQNNHLRIP
jgi:hypothetical protein